MNRSWGLTDLEFKVLCEKHGQPRLPRPFTFTSRIRPQDDYELAKSDIHSRLLVADADLDELGKALDKPDVYVVAQAWTDGDFENPADRTRMLAVRRGARGYLISQRPGETLAHSGGFDATTCHPDSLGDAVLAGLPFAESGRLPDIAVPQSSSECAGATGCAPSSSMVSDNDDPEDDDTYRARAFFDTPAIRSGYIRVYQGRSKFGPRGRIDMGVLWRDLPADGRYVVPMDHPAPVAAGSGTDEMVKWVGEQVAFVMSRLEWNREHE